MDNGATAVVDQLYDMVSVDELTLHPDNPNEADVGAIAESIEHNGFYGAVYAQRSTGHVVHGNHTLLAAMQLGLEEVPCIWLDIDDEQALRILVVDNRATRIGRDDDDKLIAALTSLAMTSRGLQGTAFDGDDLDALIAEANREPQPRTTRARSSFNVVVKCHSQDQQTQVLQRLLGMGLDASAR